MDESVRWMAIASGVAAALAVIAWWGDRRRHNRRDPDRVGCMPWTGLFFFALLAAIILLGVSGKLWLNG